MKFKKGINMNRVIKYTITDFEKGWRIEHFLKYIGCSKPIIVHLKKTPNGIMRNGVWSYTRDILQCRDELEIRFIDEKPSENIVPCEISYCDFKDMIVYEDEDILIVNKPAGLSVHPSKRHYEDSLANYCAYYFKSLNPQEGEFVFRCINRLDRDTSGLVIVAKNMLSSAILSGKLQSREIHRTYIAIVNGKFSGNGTVDLPIARRTENEIERCIDFEHGDRAVTHYECIKNFNINDRDYSLLRLNLETGRTHQIRVHMKAIGHPIIGDFIYNPDFTLIKRQALHSYSLEFNHPVTGERLYFEQNPPEDFNL
jgi:23S rRNA pseudouridine1911/1915/1917 synthase